MKNILTIVLSLFSNFLMSQVEQQNYNTLQTFNKVEIREYPPAIYASVTTEDNNNSQFGILAGYIFGGNENKQKIAMTAPVHMYQNKLEKSSTMSFVMPSEYKIDELSKPNDERIEITKSVTKRYAAISYTGYNNSEKFNKYKSELTRQLQKENIKTVGDPIYLGYDPPYKFWNRKNEVLIEIN